MTTHTEAEFECEHCAETKTAEQPNELEVSGCDESEHSCHVWTISAETAAELKSEDDEQAETEAPENWRQMDSDELKKEMGYEQRGGVVWQHEDTDPEPTEDDLIAEV